MLIKFIAISALTVKPYFIGQKRFWYPIYLTNKNSQLTFSHDAGLKFFHYNERQKTNAKLSANKLTILTRRRSMKDNHTLANQPSNNMQDNHSTESKKAFRNRNIVSVLTLLLPLLLAAQSVRLNEFMALNNSTITDTDGEYSDWIEIFNPTNAAVSLENWSVTDDRNIPQKWFFPVVSIAADSYLVIFASGKDRRDPARELHTNFKLSGDGEYLTLIDSAGNPVSAFDPAFPAQQPDLSWAYFDGDYFATTIPTPGSANQLGEGQILSTLVFSQPHGFYDSPFEVAITSTVSGVSIYYTTNGDTPDSQTGLLYTAPISITTTTVLRAIAVKSEKLTSSVGTVTYLFLKDVINQPNDPPGYPAEWGPYVAINGNAIADYEMDPEITQDSKYSGLIETALLSLPTISIVTDISNLFAHSTDPDSGGIYIYTGPADEGGAELGGGWERPASVEYFSSNNPENFQINCGLRIHGGHSRRPEKTPKHSFRLIFRSAYGAGRLNFPLLGDAATTSFNTIVLRAGFGNTWTHWRHSERIRTQLIRDIWGKDTQLAMGHPASHGTYVHLFLNGIYWGIYNPTERIDRVFAETYLCGSADDYDIIKDYNEVAEGNRESWDELWQLAKRGLSSTENYQRIQGKNPDGSFNPDYPALLDVVNFIDYMILNFYGGNWDWDHHNWIAVRNRVKPGKGFQFFSWDAEHILEDVNENFLDLKNSNCPSDLFQRLRQNADFRRLFADRVQLHCFNGGALTPEAASARWMKRAEQIELAIIAESARWGDYRRDVHPYQFGDTFMLYTKEHWHAEQDFVINEYFPQRTNVFINQLKQAGLFPQLTAPQLLINGTPVSQNPCVITSGDTLTMSVSIGQIYYTTDGSDPVTSAAVGTTSQITSTTINSEISNGRLTASAIEYSAPLELTRSTYIKARNYQNNVWSALREVIFSVPSEIYNLKITEIYYHPLTKDSLDDRCFEFLEIQNYGDSPLDLSGVKFTDGITYTFPAATILLPEIYLVLAADQTHFPQRYGFPAFAEYQGSLDNAGEQIVMTTANGDTLIAMQYDDHAPWPALADGQGYSLVAINPEADPNDPANWRISLLLHGSPGRDDRMSKLTDEPSEIRPSHFDLSQNYPNPFNPITSIAFKIAADTQVHLQIYNIRGERVAMPVNQKLAVGNYAIHWDASRFPSGIYFYVLNAGNFTDVKKMMLLK